MKLKSKISGLMALALSGVTASACWVTVHVACPPPNENTCSGIRIYVDKASPAIEAFTDEYGIANIHLPIAGETYMVCVDEGTLCPGATIQKPCQKVVAIEEDTLMLDFELGGPFCETPPSPGLCWLTGGGTVGKTKGVANYSFGGVVYPGCSPEAAEGGNWNVVDHFTGLHFQGQIIFVDSCSGVSTRSPKVDVNIIDFHGLGIIDGIAGNPTAKVAVTFVGRAVDNLEPGAGKDLLYLKVNDGASTVLQIGTADIPENITTGNLQIHTSSCP